MAVLAVDVFGAELLGLFFKQICIRSASQSQYLEPVRQ